MRMQERIGVPENLHVYTSKTRITVMTHVLDGGRDELDVCQITDPLAARQIGQTIDSGNLRQYKAVSRQPLDVTEDSDCRIKLCEHGGVGSSERRGNST